LNLLSAAAVQDCGVSQWGFYAIEGKEGEKQWRWMRDRAQLSNLFSYEPPREVSVEVLMVPQARPKPLRIEANGCVLFDGTVGDGWSSTLSLDRCDVSRGLTLSFSTTAPRGEVDRRRLGVALSSVVLR
jgi:hypothetical protein